jgi:hypothetical protein
MLKHLLQQAVRPNGVLFRLITTDIKKISADNWPKTWGSWNLKTSMMAGIQDQCSLDQVNTVIGLAQTPSNHIPHIKDLLQSHVTWFDPRTVKSHKDTP